MASQWTSSKVLKVWKLSRSGTTFMENFDTIREQIQQVTCMDDLLSGNY